MKVFTYSARSDCGTYFGSYLQEVTVVARDRAHADELLKKWMDEEGYSFVKRKYPVHVDEQNFPDDCGVVTYVHDSDY